VKHLARVASVRSDHPERSPDNRVHLRFKSWFAHQAMKALFGKSLNLREGFFANRLIQLRAPAGYRPVESTTFQSDGGSSLFRTAAMFRCATARRDVRAPMRARRWAALSISRGTRSKAIPSCMINKAFDFAAEESGFEQRVEDCVLGYEFVANRVAIDCANRSRWRGIIPAARR